MTKIFSSESESSCVPSNQFVVPVSISLNNHQRFQLYKFLNLHYLGDVDANQLNENGYFVAKYPEKETEEYKDAIWRADATHKLNAVITYDTNAKPVIKSLSKETTEEGYSDTEILEFLLDQFKWHSLEMNSQSRWTFMNTGFPMNHAKGKTAREAIINAMKAK
jgi:hypothetical protein